MTDLNTTPETVEPPKRGWAKWPAPKPKRSLKDKWAKAKWAIPVVALLLGFSAGAAAHPQADPIVQTKTETKTVTQTVEKTPQACLDALTTAEKTFTIMSDTMGAVQDGMTAVGNIDAAGVRDMNTRVGDNATKIKDLAPDWQSERDECRAKQ